MAEGIEYSSDLVSRDSSVLAGEPLLEDVMTACWFLQAGVGFNRAFVFQMTVARAYLTVLVEDWTLRIIDRLNDAAVVIGDSSLLHRQDWMVKDSGRSMRFGSGRKA